MLSPSPICEVVVVGFSDSYVFRIFFKALRRELAFFCGLPGFRAVCFVNVRLGAHFEVQDLGRSRFTVHTFGFFIYFFVVTVFV